MAEDTIPSFRLELCYSGFAQGCPTPEEGIQGISGIEA